MSEPTRPRFPLGMHLIEQGRCPVGARFAMACFLCEYGHATECHYPKTCQQAQCNHHRQDGAPKPAPFFGPCCACYQVVPLRNIAFLEQKAPTPGTGWGCVQCGLADDGAIALFCDLCADALKEIRWACAGKIDKPERVPVGQLTGKHKHNRARHPELNRTMCRVCGCTDEEACIDANGQPCRWVEPNLCSHCAIEVKLVAAGGVQ